jgi:hypothetical protein
MSVTPIAFGGFFFDVFVSLNPALPSLGELDVLSPDDGAGGGTFD